VTQLKTTMEIFKLLDQSNCRECYEKTCLAFAAAVFKGKRRLEECTHLSKDIIEKFTGNTGKAQSVEEDMRRLMEKLKQKIAAVDLSEAAQRVGGEFSKNRLTLKVLGKDFNVDSDGSLSSDIHINPWISIPLLHYVIYSPGKPASGKWISFRELKNGSIQFPLFQRRCEAPLKNVADSYRDLFKDMLEIFNGKKVENHYESDVSLVLHPLPLIPILFCYWEPDEGLESDLHIFFDQTADENLELEFLYTLTAGIVNMLQKISLRHGAR
jgi:hypothetical protein